MARIGLCVATSWHGVATVLGSVLVVVATPVLQWHGEDAEEERHDEMMRRVVGEGTRSAKKYHRDDGAVGRGGEAKVGRGLGGVAKSS